MKDLDKKTSSATNDSNVSTLNRICAILNTFSEDSQIQSLTEVSVKSQLPKSSTHRLLEALEIMGIIQKEMDGRYRLGYQLIRWGSLARTSISLRNIALPILQKLSINTGETAVLSIRDGLTGSWLEVVESKQPVRIATRLGKPLHLHAGASSKVLLAFLHQEKLEDLVGRLKLDPIMPNTITNRNDFMKELANIRAAGYATSFEETDPGAMGVAAPVLDYEGNVVCGIGIVAPINRIPRDRVSQIAPFVLEACREISRLVGSADIKQS